MTYSSLSPTRAVQADGRIRGVSMLTPYRDAVFCECWLRTAENYSVLIGFCAKSSTPQLANVFRVGDDYDRLPTGIVPVQPTP